MLELKVTVDLPGIADAIHDLAGAIRGGSGKYSYKYKTPASVSPMNADLAMDLLHMTQAQTEPEPAPVVPEEQPAPEPVPVAQPAPAPAKKYTFEQISKAGAALCSDLSNMEKLVALLNDKYHVPAITLIDEGKYPDLASDLIALGATIEEA